MDLARFGLTVRGLTWASLISFFFYRTSCYLLRWAPPQFQLVHFSPYFPPLLDSTMSIKRHRILPKFRLSVWENMRPIVESFCLKRFLQIRLCVGKSHFCLCKKKISSTLPQGPQRSFPRAKRVRRRDRSDSTARLRKFRWFRNLAWRGYGRLFKKTLSFFSFQPPPSSLFYPRNNNTHRAHR